MLGGCTNIQNKLSNAIHHITMNSYRAPKLQVRKKKQYIGKKKQEGREGMWTFEEKEWIERQRKTVDACKLTEHYW